MTPQQPGGGTASQGSSRRDAAAADHRHGRWKARYKTNRHREFQESPLAAGQEGSRNTGGNRSKGAPKSRVICRLRIPIG